MQAALIIMTILGCDDTATQCHHVEMLQERWATIQACDAVSEAKLRTFSNLDYPVVVAVCQTPGDAGLEEVANEPAGAETDVVASRVPADSAPWVPSADIPPPVAMRPMFDIPTPKADIPAPVTSFNQNQPTDAAAADDPGLAARLLQRFTAVLPDSGTLKTLASEPIHVVTDSYSWVARRFDK
ncbi:hypothetical protein IMCC20628_02146 [Hoeflea sp. IMCC20628]|uniref:hypothetical protein n=1 Tax=Hoeflea sp. IMCC20628 TaxID=1620421 RepID=UPI00063BEA8E|nr:hypothetical protein [Hoeflea sp. IMCC20628]AKI00850.1 hypothetical protein IMCC20628_02146 [Hoeflea sp. IMCC20628]